VTVQVPITGLGGSTTYHAQVTLTNEDGTVQGNDGTFTTSAPSSGGTAPIVGTESLTGAAAQTLAGLQTTVQTATSPGSYYVQYGTDTNYGLSTQVQALPTNGGSQLLSANLTGLLAGVTYHARFVV